MYITSYSISIVLLSRYVNIYDTMAPMSWKYSILVKSMNDVLQPDEQEKIQTIVRDKFLGTLLLTPQEE